MESSPLLPLDIIRAIIEFLPPSDSIALISARKVWYANSIKVLTATGQKLFNRKSLLPSKLIRLCNSVKGDFHSLNLLRSEFQRRDMNFITIGVIQPGRNWHEYEVRMVDRRVYVFVTPHSKVRYDLRLIILRTDEQEFLHQYYRNHTVNIAIICGPSSTRRIRPPCVNMRILRAKKVEEGLEDFLQLHSAIQSGK